jgi:uncharacterized membrane protein YeaQ/YmgE (transglycosylase-associated protein family)
MRFPPTLAVQTVWAIDVGTIVGYALLGLVIGALARLVVPGTRGMGIIATILIGILGAIGGGWFAGAIFGETIAVDWIASIIVAIILVWAFSGQGRRHRVTTLRRAGVGRPHRPQDMRSSARFRSLRSTSG